MPKKIEPAIRERAMRMIVEHRLEYATPTELARVIAARERIGVSRPSGVGSCKPTSMVVFGLG